METQNLDTKEILFFSTAPKPDILKKLGFTENESSYELIVNGKVEMSTPKDLISANHNWGQFLDKAIEIYNNQK